jgi:Protein of unknown function (DUF3617)
MKKIAVVIACAAALTGCNKGSVHEQNASVAQVANAVAASGVANDILLHPGEWRVSGTLEEMTIPGMPPEAQSAMKQAIGKQGKMTYDYCLTPEQAKRPQGKFFNDKAANNCRYDHFIMGGGKIDAVMRCDGKPSSTTMTIDGTYGADNYSTHVQMNMQGGPQGAMSMKMRSEARRIGECTPEDKAEAERQSGTKG